MRHEVLMEMSLEQLDDYARVCGIDATGRKTKARKVELIEERRGRVADVDVLGTTLHVPVRSLHDKRVSDMLSSGNLSEVDADRLLVLLLGEDQYARLVERCTDEDGRVDVEALGLAFGTIISDQELKNF